MKENYCVICGRAFVPARGNQVTCNAPSCKRERHRRQSLKWRDENRDAVRESNRAYMQRKREEPTIKPKPDTIVAIGYADRQREQTLQMVGKVKVTL